MEERRADAVAEAEERARKLEERYAQAKRRSEQMAARLETAKAEEKRAREREGAARLEYHAAMFELMAARGQAPASALATGPGEAAGGDEPGAHGPDDAGRAETDGPGAGAAWG